MFLLASFKIIFAAIVQIFLLALCGYVLVKKNVFGSDCLKVLSQLLINLLLPCFIFIKFVANFTFADFPRWWFFPLLSIFFAAVGYGVAWAMAAIDARLKEFYQEFVSLVAFQNSGYLPLMLVAVLLSGAHQERMFIYLLLFLFGFNLLVWSFGVFYLTQKPGKRMHVESFLNPPVIAIIASFFIIVFGLNKYVPVMVRTPVKMLGDCALPLAMLVVGGNLALISFRSRKNAHSIFATVLAKLLLMPFLFFAMILIVRPSYEIGFLLILEAAAPSATSLSVIVRNYNRQDNIISSGIFWTHLLSIITIPFFLALFSLITQHLR